MWLTIEQIAKALQRNGGYQTRAARSLGVTQQAVSLRIKRSKALQAVVEEIECQYLDVAEASLLTAVGKGEAWAVCFYLKCKGKGRGYVEKIYHGTEDDKPLKINVTVNDEKD